LFSRIWYVAVCIVFRPDEISTSLNEAVRRPEQFRLRPSLSFGMCYFYYGAVFSGQGARGGARRCSIGRKI
jgi:hypothetical protein